MRFSPQSNNCLIRAAEFHCDFRLLLDRLAIEIGGLEEPGLDGVEGGIAKHHGAANESGIGDFSVLPNQDSYNHRAADPPGLGNFRIDGGSGANGFGIHQVRLRQHGRSAAACGLGQ